VTGVVAVVEEGAGTATDRQAFRARSCPFREATTPLSLTESEIRQRRLDAGTCQVKTVLFAYRISLSSFSRPIRAVRLTD